MWARGEARRSGAPGRRRWWIVLLLALAAGIGLLAYPLLPVTQHTATYRWDGAEPAALPLSPYRPERLTVAADCRTDGVLLETVQAVDEGLRTGSGTITRREQVLALSLRTERALIELGDCSRLEIDITGDRVAVSQDGTVTDEIPGDHRPAIDSLASGPGVTGVSAVVVADTQWDSSPSTLKIVVGTVSAALLAVALALAALGDSPRRRWQAGRLRPGADDGVVLGAIVLGVIAGGATDDDGFIAQIMRTREMSGYIGNYVRWNNAPEAPFGWFYDLYALWGTISMEPVWLRILPALLGVLAWLVLRHGLAPRLLPGLTGQTGQTGPVRTPMRIALAAGFTLLWLVFCNSLRPEIFFALGSGVVLLCVLDALHRRSTWPLLVGALVAGLTVGTGPTGLVAIAPFVVAGPRLWRWLRPTGLRGLAVAATSLAALGAVVLLMFADQTLASIASANHARTEFGPIYPFWEDYQRYWKLWWSFAARQFSVYLSVIALAYLTWRWRRRSLSLSPAGRVKVTGTTSSSVSTISSSVSTATEHGVNPMVAGQVIGGALALVVVMLLAPTKLPHHFGALLLLGPLAMAAAVRLVGRGAAPVSRDASGVAPVSRDTSGVAPVSRDTSGVAPVSRFAPGVGFLLGGSLAVVGLAMHHNNTWWKLSTLGLLLDKNPIAVGPNRVWPFVVVLGLLLGLLLTRAGRRPGGVALARAATHPRVGLARAATAPRLALAYALGLAILSASQYANFAQAAIVRGPERYTMASAAIAAITGEGCKLERSLFYEPEPAAGVLPIPGTDPFTEPVTSGLRAWRAHPTQPDRLETGWFALPDEVRDRRWPLVIPASGIDEEHRVRVEYDDGSGRALTPTRKTLATSQLSDIRLHPAATVTRFRILAESDGPVSPGEEPDAARDFVVAQPRVPRTEPLVELAQRERIAVAWNLAFFAPCLDTPRQAHGRVEIADYVLSDSEQPGNMSYHSRSGGPFAGVLGLTEPSRVPVYAESDYGEAEMSALDLVRLVPGDAVAHRLDVELGTRVRGGMDRVPTVP